MAAYMIELLNMDCMEYMAGLPDKAFDLAIVDPPYGISADHNQERRAAIKWKGSSSGQWKKYGVTGWDSAIPTQEYFDELLRVSNRQIIWGGNYFPVNMPGVIVWDKGENGTLPHGELAKCSFKTFKLFRKSRVDAYINNIDAKIHPTQKPQALYRWILENYSEPSQRILDTHLGSGSSAIAAHYFGCEFVGTELDPDYFNAMQERFNAETSQIAMEL